MTAFSEAEIAAFNGFWQCQFLGMGAPVLDHCCLAISIRSSLFDEATGYQEVCDKLARMANGGNPVIHAAEREVTLHINASHTRADRASRGRAGAHGGLRPLIDANRMFIERTLSTGAIS
jgi:hypothetical protein